MDYKRLIREALQYAKDNGFTGKQIAKISGISTVTVWQWLNNKSVPTISNLEAVVNACGKQLKLRMI